MDQFIGGNKKPWIDKYTSTGMHASFSRKILGNHHLLVIDWEPTIFIDLYVYCSLPPEKPSIQLLVSPR